MSERIDGPTDADYWRQIQARVKVPLTGKPMPATVQAIRRELELYGAPFPETDEPHWATVGENPRQSYEETWRRTTNFSGVLKARGVCFHHSDGPLTSNIDWLVHKAAISRASYHCIIDEDGSRVRLVDDRRRAWHAGFGKFREGNPNDILLGVSFTGNTRTGKFRSQARLNSNEIASALEFLGQRWETMGFSLDWMTHHRACDPGRRDDLPDDVWAQLRAAIEEKFGRP